MILGWRRVFESIFIFDCVLTDAENMKVISDQN